jgi:hypothetical protein
MKREQGWGVRASWLLVGASGLSAAGCFSAVEMPAPADPSRDVPYVAASMGPAVPGRQSVVLETPGDNALVQNLVGHMSTTDSEGNAIEADATKDLCVTPCVADLHMGKHTLLFTSKDNPLHHDQLDVQLGSDPLVVRHVIEQTAPSQAGAIGMGVLGFLGSVTGAVMGPVGAQHGDKGVEEAGYATLGVSGALFVGGILYGYFHRGTHTPGATTQWTIPRSGQPTASAPPSGPPALVRF